MSIQSVAAVFERSKATGNERLVLLAIANHVADRDGELVAWPSQERIASEALCSVRTVRTAIHSLVDRGELAIVRQGRKIGNEGQSTIYRVTLDSQPATSAAWADSQPATGCRRTVDLAQDLAPLGLDVDLETFPSERSFGTSTTATTPSDPGASRAREASEGERYSEQLCLLLAAKIEANGCRRPTVTKLWLDAARRLVDIDGQSPHAVERCIEWATSHDFWAANILSMPTLRKQWDRLEMQARREKQARGSGMGKQYDEAMAGLADARDRALARQS